MLDFGSLKQQINEMAADRKSLQSDFGDRVDLAVSEMERWEGGWDILSNRIASSRTSWLVARPGGPFSEVYLQPERPAELTVIAADGSQIFPDRHEVASCYLINIGSVAIHYGSGERPAMASRPTLIYKEADLIQEWAGWRTTVTREMVGVRRGAMEFDEVVNLAEDARAEGRTVVGLSDGTLILWMLEGKPSSIRREILGSTLSSFERMRGAGVPVAGYISQPGSADVVNGLRVGMCPERPPNCDRCPWKTQEGSELPCEPIEGVTDGVLFKRLLKKGERSAVFGSASKILDDYGGHRICFFYVNTGAEIARIEVPEWVVEGPELLDLVHATVCDQAEKGNGYPVALSEAHERAVVRGTDREIFYKFLRDVFVERDLKAEISVKSLKKLAVSV